MKTLLAQPVLDAKGRPIVKGCIVGMANPESYWSSYQGLVAEPHSDMESDPYTVPVFFNKEVSASYFRHAERNSGTIMTQKEWDRQHGPDYQKAILSSESWKTCPRVVFFRPDELMVEADWKFEHLVHRLFPRIWAYYTISFPLIRGTHACWIRECPGVATELALVNVWGSVFPLYVCPDCFGKWNGLRVEEPPKYKNPLPGSTHVLQAA